MSVLTQRQAQRLHQQSRIVQRGMVNHNDRQYVVIDDIVAQRTHHLPANLYTRKMMEDLGDPLADTI